MATEYVSENRLWSDSDPINGEAKVTDQADHDWKLSMSLEDMAKAINLADDIPTGTLNYIGAKIKEGFNADVDSRTTLDRNLKLEVELAMQISEETKTYPFEGASNVKMPIVTTAVLQYYARAYEALYNNGRLVDAKTPSGDEDRNPAIAVSCLAVEKDIAYQLLKEDEDWDEGMQKVLIAQAVSGNVFKKTYYDPEIRKMRSVPVFADRFIVHYYAKSLASCERQSQILNYTQNELYSLKAKGVFCELPDYKQPEPVTETDMDRATDMRHGVERPAPTWVDPTEFVECHTVWDLDGDGYMEPVIVTFRRCDGAVARIVANFESDGIIRDILGRLVGITPLATFTKYGFIPSPNGSFYDFGFGRLMYSLNKTVNTLINMMIDAGKLQTMPRGLYDKKIADQFSGKMSFAPGQFKAVKLHGVDLKNVFHQIPVPEVSNVLFQLLGLLIQYGDRVSGSTEVRSGENPGQNTKVGTMDALIAEGATVFNGIYRRTRLAFSHELEKVFKINKKYIKDMLRSDERKKVCSVKQYGDVEEIYPACSFQYITAQQRLKANMQVLQIASTVEQQHPGSHNMGLLLADIYNDLIPGTADKYLNRDFKNPTGLPSAPPNPKIDLEKAKLQQTGQKIQSEAQIKAQKIQLDAQKEQREAAVSQADIQLKKAQAIEIIESLKDADEGHMIAALDALIGLQKHKMTSELKGLELQSKLAQGGNDEPNQGNASAMATYGNDAGGIPSPSGGISGDEGGGG